MGQRGQHLTQWSRLVRRDGYRNEQGNKGVCFGRKSQQHRPGGSTHGHNPAKLIFDVGGGVLDGKQFKAAQTGGPSGGCIPESLLDLPIDYESLAKAGAIMGSGGLIVMDEETCMVDTARYFLNFTQNESCGKCVPCRMGTKRMLEILTRICEGNGKPEDIEILKEMGEVIKDASLCGLGQTAPNPVLTTLNQFLNEYEEHIPQPPLSSRGMP